ncbi:hypothetical protein DPMN_093612 [Dreissena polymorpha]|uniref:Uncharacterized protein n=1 Tax=Dreissena polymorpha TaxID=45954 RepID=A0A9D4R120_DREPO|nr:hypothetical protein DPMN_093612 [Dreissena polymorpha]
MTKKDKVVYEECAEECARKMEATFKLYSGCDVSVMPLATWSREQNQLSLPGCFHCPWRNGRITEYNSMSF